jgi:3-hydroxymyristoyl/3-hydroxydecanoyl-(acyl carrier protein) dehydratase
VSEPVVANAVTTLCIHGDHAALAGHFPGRPIVPGVVLLDLAVDYAQFQFGSDLQIVCVDQAKFLAPLLPDQEAQLTLSRSGSKLRFSIQYNSILIAHGSFALVDARP